MSKPIPCDLCHGLNSPNCSHCGGSGLKSMPLDYFAILFNCAALIESGMKPGKHFAELLRDAGRELKRTREELRNTHGR